MEPQKSLLMPILLSVLATGFAVGGIAYEVGVNQSDNQPVVVTTVTPLATSTPNPTATLSPTTSPSAATTTDTSTWKTYTNSQYSFTFKYPPTWKVENNSAKNDPVMELALIDTSNDSATQAIGDGPIFPIVFSVAKDDVNSSIDTYLSGGRASLKSELQPQTVTVAGKTAYVLKGSGSGNSGYDNDRIIFSGGYIYSFDSNVHIAGHSFSSDPIGTPATQAINKIFDAILTTVQITK